jgi:hypothetical protein
MNVFDSDPWFMPGSTNDKKADSANSSENVQIRVDW